MVIWLEKEDGSFVTELPEHEYNISVDEGVVWEGNLLVSTNPNIKVVYNENRIWKEKIKNIGRNDKCICGSGKKFKKCCLNKEVA
jgi:uncharacterized protein YecA (UPF0149 family)